MKLEFETHKYGLFCTWEYEPGKFNVYNTEEEIAALINSANEPIEEIGKERFEKHSRLVELINKKNSGKIGGILKRLFLIFLIFVALRCSGIIFSSRALAAEDSKGAHVVATYFHGAFRCSTCHKLEQYSKEAIETNFKDALASGKLEFKIVNVEDRGNEHYANDYQLYTKSLILSLVKGGKEIKWKNMDKIWEYVGNKKRFIDYVKSEVADLLKEAP